jgi:hypothetical protein
MGENGHACCSACAERGAADGPPPLPKTFVGFVGSSLSLALLLGVSTGAWSLFQMTFGVGAVLPSHTQLHGHVQILGFAGLFIAGIALFALPRILGTPPPPARLQSIVLLGLGGGVFLRALGQPLAPWAAGRLLCLLSGGLELAGAFAFAWWVTSAARDAARAGDPLARHVLAGGIYAVATAAISALQALWLSGSPEPRLPLPLTEAFSFAGLFGFVLAFVYAFASRMVPVQIGLPPVRHWQRSAALLQALGVTTALVAFALYDAEPVLSRHLELAAYMAVALSAVSYVTSSGLLKKSARADGPRPRWALRLPVAALLLWALFVLAAVVYEIASGVYAHRFVWDGARHLFTLGFLTLLIVVLGSRIVPAFAGRPPAPALLRTGAIGLVALSAALRLLQVPVGLGAGGPLLYRLAGLSGFVAFAGLALFAGGLFRALRSAPAVRPVTRPEGLALPVRS